LTGTWGRTFRHPRGNISDRLSYTPSALFYLGPPDPHVPSDGARGGAGPTSARWLDPSNQREHGPLSRQVSMCYRREHYWRSHTHQVHKLPGWFRPCRSRGKLVTYRPWRRRFRLFGLLTTPTNPQGYWLQYVERNEAFLFRLVAFI
jgi:hypothetical protein